MAKCILIAHLVQDVVAGEPFVIWWAGGPAVRVTPLDGGADAVALRRHLSSQEALSAALHLRREPWYGLVRRCRFWHPLVLSNTVM